MKTTEEREKHFRDELKSLLNRHGAEIIITDYGKPHGIAICQIQMDEVYDDNGDLIADYSEFTL